MRIGLVVPGFSADAADWCIPALRHLARALARSDDLRVFALRYPFRPARYAVDGAAVTALGGAQARGPAALAVWRNTLRTIGREHRQRPFDVLHAFWATESGFLTAVAGKALRIPTLVSLAGGELVALPDIGYGDQRFASERLKIRASLTLATALSAGSDYLLKLAQRHVSRGQLRRAPLGVDLLLFKPTSYAQSSPRLVHVATLTSVKDQLTLVRAFRLLRQGVPDATLDIVGDGPMRPELQQLISWLGLSEAVHLRGELDHTALPAIHGTASVFVLSSRHEAQGMVAIEAAACGLAVAGTDVGVIPELALRGRGVAPVGDAEALARSLAATLENAHEGGGRALEIAQSEFSLSRSVSRFRQLYAELAAR